MRNEMTFRKIASWGPAKRRARVSERGRFEVRQQQQQQQKNPNLKRRMEGHLAEERGTSR
jgi:hypothetical protein